MKKTIVVCISLLLLLGACSSDGNKKDMDNKKSDKIVEGGKDEVNQEKPSKEEKTMEEQKEDKKDVEEIIPVQPEKPSTPVKPQEPTKPIKPEQPVEPEKPVLSDSEKAYQVFLLVNQERSKVGLAPLEFASGNLNQAAQVRAQELNILFDKNHNRPNGEICFTVLDEYNVSYLAAGENIAFGQITPEQVMNDWMNSPGHRENILSASYTTIAIAVVNNRWVQLFIG